MSDSPDTNLAEAYVVSNASKELERLIPPRRHPFAVLAPLWRNPDSAEVHDTKVPVKALELEESFDMTDRALTESGLTDFLGCSSFERAHPKRRGWAKRPITHAVKASDQKDLISLFHRLGPQLYKHILDHLKPPLQSYDKRSRVGAPYFAHFEHKLEILRPHFVEFLAGDLSLLDSPNMMVINNIRLQPEKKGRSRDFIYLDEGGVAYLESVGEKEKYDEKYKRWCSRVRLVFNYPVANLLTQVLDSAIHNFFLEHHTFHHNMTREVGRPIKGSKIFVDCKHFERSVGAVVRDRCQLIGGLYAQIMEKMLALPYLVPSDAGNCKLVRIAHDKGYVEQMGSGVSCVAPLAKEMLTLIYTDFFMTHFNLSFDGALAAVLNGGNERVSIKNYGDDNVLFGDSVAIEDCFTHLGRYLTVEKEEPPKFLGYHYTDETGFFLSRNSYVLNFYLAERPPKSKFRPYPFLGRKLRKEVFKKEGEPYLRESFFPFEEAMLTEAGYTEPLMAEAAEWEAFEARKSAIESNPKWILGKDYQLTDSEKAQDRERYDVLMPSETAGMIRTLLEKRSGRRNPQTAIAVA